MRVGLRFRRSQGRVLEALTERAQIRDIAEAASLFGAAAEAARTGEPMMLECADLDEARKVAQGFPRYGVVEPTIEEVFR